MDKERIHENNIERLIENLGDNYNFKIGTIYNMFREKYENNSQVKEYLPLICYRSTADYFKNN